MKKYIDLSKKHISIVSFLLVSIILCIIYIINKIEPFGNNTILVGDSFDQYLPFYSLLRDKLLNGDIFSVHNFSYSWKVGIGTNFLLLYFYYLASPLNFLIIFIPKTELTSFLSVLIIIKLSLSAASFSYYLNKSDRPHSFGFIIAFSIAYALSGFMCGYFWNIMWLDDVVLFPIVILGVDNVIKGKNPILYIFSLFLTIYLNFYIAFMVCIFLVIYFLINITKEKQSIVRTSLTFILSSILAAGMSAFSLFVIYFGIKKTMTAGNGFPSFGFIGNVFYTLRQSLFMEKPIVVDRTGYDGFANIYSGVLTILLIIIYFISDKISFYKKIKSFILVFLLVISMNEYFFNFIWHGFHKQFLLPNRFSFMLVFVVLIIGYDAIEIIKNTSRKRLYLAGLFSVSYPIICFIFVDFDGYYPSDKIVIINVMLILIYCIGIFLVSQIKEKSRYIIKGLTAFFIFEIGLSALFSFKEVMIFRDITNTYSLYDYVKHSKTNDYRAEILNPDLTNGNSFVGINGVSSFCSTISGDSIYTMMDFGLKGLTNQIKYQESIHFVDSIFGIKYFYYTDDNGVPLMHQNDDILSYGYAVNDDLINYEPSPDFDFGNNCNMFSALATDNDSIIFSDLSKDMSVTSLNCNIINGYKDNSIKIEKIDDSNAYLGLEYVIKEDGMFYFYIGASSFEGVNITINDTMYASGDIVNGVICLNYLAKGDKVDIYFETAKNTPVLWYLYEYNTIAGDEILSELSSSEINISEFKEGELKGRINIEDGKSLLLSIPYDSGWKIKCNGKSVASFPLVRGLTGVNLDEGINDLYMVYTPKGFYLGCIISFISWFIFFSCSFYSCFRRGQSYEKRRV